MTTINEFMTRDHRRCDELMAAAEDAVNKQDWATAENLTEAFQAAIEHHFDMEEQVLFPAFEQQTGIVQGPTMMMRSEHQQMRGLLFQLKDALERQEEEDFLDTTETLLVMMQQHNMKEEGILYPMSDEQLSDVDQIIAGMENLAAA
jgi:hemerythrin-like domain-containing protein